MNSIAFLKAAYPSHGSCTWAISAEILLRMRRVEDELKEVERSK